MAISPRGVVRSTSCLVLRWGFRFYGGGGAAVILKNSNGDISAANHPLYCVFGSRTGFSGSADGMALFPVSPNPRWRLLKNSNGDISAADHPIYSVFGSRTGFSGSADRMTLISV